MSGVWRHPISESSGEQSELERMKAEVERLQKMIGDPPLMPRPGKTLRDEAEEVTAELNRAEDRIVELTEDLKDAHILEERFRDEVERLEAEIERLREIAEKNLPMISTHIDKHPDVAKRMVTEVQKYLTEEPKEDQS